MAKLVRPLDRQVGGLDACGGGSADLPDGQITSCFASLPVQPLSQKYFCFGPRQISSLIRIVPSHLRGGSRVVTNAGRDAVDARASGAQWQSQGEMNLVSGQLACKMIGA